jgi:hypothetical protein
MSTIPSSAIDFSIGSSQFRWWHRRGGKSISALPAASWGGEPRAVTELSVLSLIPYSAEAWRGVLYGNYVEGDIVKHVNAIDFARLSKSHMEMSDHIVVLTAIVGAMVTTASVDHERLEDCVNFAAKRYRPGHRPPLLGKAVSVLHDLGATQRALVVENRKERNCRKRRTRA